MILFNRRSSLIIGDSQYNSDTLDFDFTVPFSTSSENDVSEVAVYNLSPTSVKRIKKGTDVSLSAGYGDDTGMILNGEVVSYRTVSENADKKTVLKVSSKIHALREKNINRTYAVRITSKDILTDLSFEISAAIGEINPVKNVTYKKGKTISGRVYDIIKDIAEETESKFYIDKNRIYIRDKNKASVTGFLLSNETGLISSPEEKEDGFNVMCLLNHNIYPDSMIIIKSKTVNGNFRVVKGRHTSDYITEMEVCPCL